MKRVFGIGLFVAMCLSVAACTVVPATPATATSPGAPATLQLDPKAQSALEALAAGLGAAGMAGAATPWGQILLIISGIITTGLAGFGTGHSVGSNSATAAANATPTTPASPTAPKAI